MIHFIYPFDAARFAAPWSIGNEVAAGLRAHGRVVQQYDWQDRSTIIPSPGDVLLGHPHPRLVQLLEKLGRLRVRGRRQDERGDGERRREPSARRDERTGVATVGK